MAWWGACMDTAAISVQYIDCICLQQQMQEQQQHRATAVAM